MVGYMFDEFNSLFNPSKIAGSLFRNMVFPAYGSVRVHFRGLET